MKQPLALVSDFDGTISDDDFFNYIARAYFDEKALSPWREYLSGNKKHFDALAEMFAKVRVSVSDLNKLIDSIKLDTKFIKLAEFCSIQNIPVYICSAGSDYYIRRCLKNAIERLNITIISNSGAYSPKTGLIISPNQQYYDEQVGVSKIKIVQKLQQQGYFVIYCGDGLPDIEAAKQADKVFARKELLRICQQQKIKVSELDNFLTVQKFIQEKNR